MFTDLATKVGRLKHWQVFVPIVVAFVVIGFRQANAMDAYIANPGRPDFEALDGILIENMILSMPIFAALLFWIWSIASCSEISASKINNAAATRAAVALIFAFVYMGVSPWIFPRPSTIDDPIVPMQLVMVLHMSAVFGMVYAFGVAAKLLVSAENDSVATFHEYLGTFFLIWFFPIGVWNVQPRLNAVVNRARLEQSVKY